MGMIENIESTMSDVSVRLKAISPNLQDKPVRTEIQELVTLLLVLVKTHKVIKFETMRNE